MGNYFRKILLVWKSSMVLKAWRKGRPRMVGAGSGVSMEARAKVQVLGLSSKK